MTRLQKNAVKKLAILLLAVFTVSITYVLTRNLIHSLLCWLGLLGLLGFLLVRTVYAIAAIWQERGASE